MRILFWGTPVFAVPSLRALADEGFEIVGVVTQPARPAGRGRSLTGSPVYDFGLEQGFDVFTPEVQDTDVFISAIRALEPDISVVVAYGHILPQEILDLPRLGSINVHASLLPKLRGAAPIHWAIARGHAETGVTIMQMVEAMDAGAIIHQIREPILSDETASDMTTRLSELGAEAVIEALALIAVGQADEVEQDHDNATYAPKIDRAAARVDWSRSNREVAAHVRGMDAFPGAWSEVGGIPIKLFRPSVVSSVSGADSEPGVVLRAEPGEGVLVQTGDGGVLFDEVQPPNRRRMTATDWIIGRGIERAQRFE